MWHTTHQSLRWARNCTMNASLSRCIHNSPSLSQLSLFFWCSYFFDGFCLINGLRSIQLFINGRTSPSRVNGIRIQNMFSRRDLRVAHYSPLSHCVIAQNTILSHQYPFELYAYVRRRFEGWCIGNKARIITRVLGSRICLMTKTLRTHFAMHNCTLLAAQKLETLRSLFHRWSRRSNSATKSNLNKFINKWMYATCCCSWLAVHLKQFPFAHMHSTNGNSPYFSTY